MFQRDVSTSQTPYYLPFFYPPPSWFYPPLPTPAFVPVRGGRNPYAYEGYAPTYFATASGIRRHPSSPSFSGRSNSSGNREERRERTGERAPITPAETAPIPEIPARTAQEPENVAGTPARSAPVEEDDTPLTTNSRPTHDQPATNVNSAFLTVFFFLQSYPPVSPVPVCALFFSNMC
jgi:hypothetical protein